MSLLDMNSNRLCFLLLFLSLSPPLCLTVILLDYESDPIECTIGDIGFEEKAASNLKALVLNSIILTFIVLFIFVEISGLKKLAFPAHGCYNLEGLKISRMPDLVKVLFEEDAMEGGDILEISSTYRMK